MKYRMLDVLVCPKCRKDLSLKNEKVEKALSSVGEGLIRKQHCELFCGYHSMPVKEAGEALDCVECFRKEITGGFLYCSSCSAQYSIINKIPRMLPLTANHKGAEQVRNRFEFQWESWGEESKIFGRTHEENTAYILKGHSTATKQKFFERKLVLDGGCGHGRFLKSFSSLGAEVIGIDFGSGIDVAARFNEGDGLVHPVMGDLLNLPLRNESINYAFSTGVIHHTPDPRRAFHNLSNATKKGGMMFIWVYPKEGVLWEVSQKALRAVLTRLPARMLYYLCFIPVPLLSFVKTYSSTSLKTASWRQCAQVIYDWYSPKYQFHYSEDELKNWFLQEGFANSEFFYIRTGMAAQKT